MDWKNVILVRAFTGPGYDILTLDRSKNLGYLSSDLKHYYIEFEKYMELSEDESEYIRLIHLC